MKKTTVMQTKKKKVFDIRSDIYKVFGQWRRRIGVLMGSPSQAPSSCWMGTSLKNFNDICQHSRKKRPESVGTLIRALQINTSFLRWHGNGRFEFFQNGGKFFRNSSRRLFKNLFNLFKSLSSLFKNLSSLFKNLFKASPSSSDSLTPRRLFRIVINGHTRVAQRFRDILRVQVHLVSSLSANDSGQFFHLAFDVNSQISLKNVSEKRQTNNFRSVVAFFVEILGLWTVSWATSIILRQKKGPRRIFMPGLLRFELQTKCSGCKMSVLCLLGTVPFWWRWWYCRHGFNFTKFCGCYCKVCAFALFFQESFLRSFWFPFSLMLPRWPPTRVGPGWPRNSRPGWAALHPGPQFVFGQVVLSCFAAS